MQVRLELGASRRPRLILSECEDAGSGDQNAKMHNYIRNAYTMSSRCGCYGKGKVSNGAELVVWLCLWNNICFGDNQI